MFAGDRAVSRENLAEQLVERSFGAFDCGGIVCIEHDVDVDVAVTGVAEAGDW